MRRRGQCTERWKHAREASKEEVAPCATAALQKQTHLKRRHALQRVQHRTRALQLSQRARVGGVVTTTANHRRAERCALPRRQPVHPRRCIAHVQLAVLDQRPAAGAARLDALSQQRRAIEIVERHVRAPNAHWRARDCVDKRVPQLHRRALDAATPSGSKQVDDAKPTACALSDTIQLWVVRVVCRGIADLEVDSSAIARGAYVADAYASRRVGVARATEVAAQECCTIEADVDGVASAQLARRDRWRRRRRCHFCRLYCGNCKYGCHGPWSHCSAEPAASFDAPAPLSRSVLYRPLAPPTNGSRIKPGLDCGTG